MENSALMKRSATIDGRRPQEGVPFVPAVPSYFDNKTLGCKCVGWLLLFILSPVLLLAMALVRLTSSGPALFLQTRLGKDLQPFKIIKLRTMYIDAESLSGPTLCKPGDSRITPLGRWLRLLHIDEIPQLLNVIRGEMCLVGPRPERPEIIDKNHLREIVPGFDERMKVLPGITGLAQINLPADESALSVIPKVQLDLDYIRNANALLDFRILCCTALRMLGIRYGIAVRLFRLNRPYTMPEESEEPVACTETAPSLPVDTICDVMPDDETLCADSATNAAEGAEINDRPAEAIARVPSIKPLGHHVYRAIEQDIASQIASLPRRPR